MEVCCHIRLIFCNLTEIKVDFAQRLVQNYCNKRKRQSSRSKRSSETGDAAQKQVRSAHSTKQNGLNTATLTKKDAETKKIREICRLARDLHLYGYNRTETILELPGSQTDKVRLTSMTHSHTSSKNGITNTRTLAGR